MSNDKPPNGAVATAEDHQHQRDGEGELVPVWEPIPGATTDCPECGGRGFILEDSESDGEPARKPCSDCSGTGEVSEYAQVIPLTQGDAQRYLPETGEIEKMTDDDIVALLDEFFVQPDFDIDRSKSAEDALDSFLAFSVEPLIMTLYNASGFDYAKSAMMENSDMAEVIDQIEGNSATGN